MADETSQQSIGSELPQEMVETTDLPADSPVYQELQEQRRETLTGEGEAKILKISCHSCGQKLDLTNFPAFSRVACPECGTELIVPKWFDNYLLEEAGGEGGMATVYRALDLALDREVAIKVLNADLGSKQEVSELFLHEARTAATINHHAVVPIYTCGIFEDQTYIVMQFMSGGSLEDLLEKNAEPLPIAHVVSWIRDTAMGLQNACEHGIIHHDIKPANIMLDQEGKAKICDFGISQVVSGKKEDAAAKLTGSWVSPHYVSPEKLVDGKEDFRGDIYSLGATFYHLITGTTPFTENDLDELFRIKVNNDPMAPMHHRKSIPETINNLILAMMSRDPEKRPTYGAIIGALDKYLANPAAAGKTGAKRPGARRPAKRNAAGGANAVAAQLAHKQKAAQSPVIVTMKVLSQILTVLVILMVGIWLLHKFDRLNDYIDIFPRFMQASKKSVKAENTLNTSIVNGFQSGYSEDAQKGAEDILANKDKKSTESLYQAVLQAAYAAFLNQDLRKIDDGIKRQSGKEYVEILLAEQKNNMKPIDLIRAEDNIQLLEFFTGLRNDRQLDSPDQHFPRGEDFQLKRAVANLLIAITEKRSADYRDLLDELKAQLEKHKASWVFDAFNDRIPFWEQALLKHTGRINEVEPIFRDFIEKDIAWEFAAAEKKQKFSKAPVEKKVEQVNEAGKIIGGPIISMERLKEAYLKTYAPLNRPQPKNAPQPYDLFFGRGRSTDYLKKVEAVSPAVRVEEAKRMIYIQKNLEKFLQAVTEKEPIQLDEIRLTYVARSSDETNAGDNSRTQSVRRRKKSTRRTLKTYLNAKMQFTQYEMKITHSFENKDRLQEEAETTSAWNSYPASQMLKILIAAAEKRSAQPKKTMEDVGKQGMKDDEMDRARGWLLVAHWAHWYGDLETTLRALKEIQKDTMGNNTDLNYIIEGAFLKVFETGLDPADESILKQPAPDEEPELTESEAEEPEEPEKKEEPEEKEESSNNSGNNAAEEDEESFEEEDLRLY